MRISTRTRYSTRALVDLTLHKEKGPVALREIAGRQEISLAYLEQLIGPLVAGGILRTTRGPGGGLSLARPPQEIRMGQIFRLLEGSVTEVACVGDPQSCSSAESCATRSVWCELEAAANNFLDTITLRDLAEKQREKSAHGNAVYHI